QGISGVSVKNTQYQISHVKKKEPRTIVLNVFRKSCAVINLYIVLLNSKLNSNIITVDDQVHNNTLCHKLLS
ncbi:hypothetical protein BUY96_13830, partial [Staphylococcus gallinarum]